MRLRTIALLGVLSAFLLAERATAQFQGPSTGSTPYVLPVAGNIQTISILTTDNTGANPDDSVGVSSYGMDGIPDGLGAFDNGNGEFTVLMNHELPNNTGVARAHGGIGAYVSKLTINKNTLAVTAGSDLMQQTFGWNTATQSSNAATFPYAFNRFCSGDLPDTSGLSFQGIGTTNRIYLHGEEGGATGWDQASVVTGPDAGKSYTLGKFNLNQNGSATSTLSPVQLNVLTASTGSTTVTVSGVPRELAAGAQLLGQTVNTIVGTTITLSGNASTNITSPTLTNFTLAGVGAWENTLVCPFPQEKTVVIGNSDGGTGIHNNALSVYVGTKTNAGTEADKAGLTNGTMKFVNVTGNAAEIVNSTTRATNITSGTAFTLSATASTAFSRPEDGAWNPANPKQYYFVTTDQLDQVSDGTGASIGQTRLWRLTFSDITNPDAGGTIDLLIDGRTVGGKKVNMFDNIAVNPVSGHIILQEDVGNAAHNGKMWEYDPATDALTMITKHDPARFGDIGLAATAPFNVDEETSGVIDVTGIMAGSSMNLGLPGEAWYLSSDQAHYTTGITASQVEGGQLFLIHSVPEPASVSLLALGAIGLLAVGRRRGRA
jgi:hypothetical protein